MTLGALSAFGTNASTVIWEFAAGVITFLFTAVVILTAIQFIKTLLK